MTNPTERIKQLQHEIESEKRKIYNCEHIFGKPYYNPEKVMEGYGSVQDGAGSDPHWSYAGYREVEVSRWSKKCSKCGFEKHTFSKKPIIIGEEPDFK